MGNIHQTFTGDSNQLLREIEKTRQANVKLEEQNRKLALQANRAAHASKTQHSQTSQFLRSQLSGVMSLAAGYLSLQGAISLYNAEMQAQRQLQKDALDKQMTVAQGQDKVLDNFGPGTDAEIKSFFARVKATSDKTKYGRYAEMLGASSDLLSSVGGDRDMVISILEAASPHFRQKSSADLSSFGQSIGATIKSTGLSAEESVAALMGIQNKAHFTSYESFKNVTPVLGSALVSAPNIDKRQAVNEAAAIFAAMSHHLDDRSGERTKTPVANLLENLQRVAPDLNSHFERLRAVQANPELQEEVLKSGFEAANKAHFRALLSSSSGQHMKDIEETFNTITIADTDVKRLARQRENLTPELSLATEIASAAGLAEDRGLDNKIGSRIEKVRTDFQKIMEDTRAPWTTDRIALEQFERTAGDDPEAAAITLLKQRKEKMEETIKAKTDGNPLSMSFDSRSADRMSELVGSIDKMIAELERNREELAKRNRGGAQTAVGAGREGGN